MPEHSADLLEQLLHLETLLHRYQLLQRHSAAPDGPNRSQGRLLALLKMQPRISQKDLAFLLDLRAPALNQLLARLEAQDLIRLSPAAEDPRITMVRLTKKGAAAAATEEQAKEPILACLSTPEQEQLSEYLLRLTEELERRLAGNWASGNGAAQNNDTTNN